MEGDGIATQSSLRMMMRKGMSWIGLRKDVPVESTIHYGEQWQDQRPGKDVVLDHIILDLTGGPVPLEHTEDPSVQRAIKKKKRLLRHSNTVLFSRLAIMVLVAIMLVVTTLLTWYFTSTYSARSVKSLATVLRQQLLRTSTQTMVSILGEVYNSTLMLSYLHQQVFFGSSNRSWESVELELRRVNRGIFNAQHGYSSVAFVSVDGRVTDYSRSSNTSKEYFFFVNATYEDTQVWYYQDLTGIVNETDAPPPQLRTPPYPLSAENVLNIKPQEVIWTIAHNSLGVPVMSPAVPTRDIITNTFLGLATITTNFQNMNQYLAALDLLGGFLYFEWHNETGRSKIVAFSYSGTKDILASPQNASNPIVKAAATFLVHTYGNVTSLGETHDENVDLGGHKYYIDTMAVIQEPYNILNLTAVMIVPRKSIMGRIDQRNRTVVGSSVGTSLGVLVLGCCFICFLTSKMSTEMQLRQELIRSLVGKHRAEQSSNYKSQFLANMSHELRTPLAGIIGLLDLLSCDSLTSEQEFSVSQVRRCATGLLSLVNNVLDISKVEAGRMELEIVPFSVANELESLVDMFAAQSVGSRIDIVLDLSDNIPPVVSGDVTRIRQIFSNLISNSVKFTTSGHVLVRGWIDQSLLEPDGRHIDINVNKLSGRDKISGPLFMGTENKVALVFEVDDSGCGIPVELHDMVFESFVQGDSSTTRVYGGSGLGLYIVRSLVELMGGEVAVVPTESGTLIRFHIIVERASTPILGQRISGDHPALSSPSEPDGLYSLLGFPSNLFEPVKCPLPEVLQRTQVLVAMQEGVAQKVAVQWLERSGIVKVTCVKGWEDIIPTLEDMCKTSLIESRSVKDVQEDDLTQHGIGPHHSLTHVHSPKSSSQLSENSLESVNFPSFLALIDVTMYPSMNMGFEGNFVGPRVLGSRESALCKADHEPLPSHMQDILACMKKIHSQHSIAVGWIVPTDCGARWKQALQADGCFLVMNKPLHGSRMRRLLALLSRTGKLEQHHWEVHSYQSSSTSTPKLRTTTCTSPSEGEDLQSHMADYRELSGRSAWTPSDRSMYTAPPSSDEEVMYCKAGNVGRVTGLQGSLVDARGKAEPVVKRNGEFGLQASLPDSSEESRKIGWDTTDSPNLQVVPSSLNVLPHGLSRLQVDNSYGTDERRRLLGIHSQHSPISGLITPQVENSSADGVQIVQRDEAEVRDIEEEQNGPVIGLGLPEKVQLMQSLVSGRPAPITDPKPEGQLSHEKTVAIPDGSSAGQASILSEVKNTMQSSQENTATTQVGSTTTANSASVYGSKALYSMHILLVEDTPVLQRLASMMLKKLGANVTVVGDGLQAVTAVTEAVAAAEGLSATRLNNIPHFDLILMDCAMPVMDGYNATKAIRAAEENTSRHIPIVALTAHALASDEQRCLAVGMDAYLTKPINCKLMVSTIQDLVSKGRA